MAILSATGKSTAKDAFNNEANLNNFTAEMDVAITGINKTVRYEMARAVIAGFEGMVFNTPVRTGYAAGEWQVVGESQNIKPRKKDKNRAVRGWDSEHERLDRSRGKKKFSYWPTGGSGSKWIIEENEIESVAKKMGRGTGPSSYTEKVGVGTYLDNIKKPSWVVEKGIEKISGYILAKDKRGHYKKIQNFQLVNTAPHLQLLENGYGSATIGFVKKEFQRMMGMYNAAKPGKLNDAEKKQRDQALAMLALSLS